MKSPRGVAVDAYGNIYISDTDNRRIRVVTKSTGVITTVAGDGLYGYSGDGGQATAAQLYDPRGVAICCDMLCYAVSASYIIDTALKSIVVCCTLVSGADTSVMTSSNRQ